MPISHQYYIFLLSIGIPYEGEVEMPDGTILYSVCDVQVLAPEHQDIFNPPRFPDSGNYLVLLRQCTLILPPQQKNRELDADADINSLAQTMQNTLTISGFALSLAELSSGITTFRTHRMGGTKFSPKLYRNGWLGGSRGGIKTHSLAKVFRTVGTRVFFIGAIYELHLADIGEQTGGKAATNIVFGGITTFGGVPGLIIGVAYFGLDALGIFDGPEHSPLTIEQQMQRFDINEYNRVRQDKIRIAMPHNMYELKQLPVLDSAQLQKLLLDK